MLFLYSMLTLIVPSVAVVCWQCGGEWYGGGLRVFRSSCCRPVAKVCGHGLACLRATVTSPESTFILSGCHPPEDGLIGCDTHQLPYNATIQRCVCLDSQCQQYFPGTCSDTTVQPPSTTVPTDVFTDLVYHSVRKGNRLVVSAAPHHTPGHHGHHKHQHHKSEHEAPTTPTALSAHTNPSKTSHFVSRHHRDNTSISGSQRVSTYVFGLLFTFYCLL